MVSEEMRHDGRCWCPGQLLIMFVTAVMNYTEMESKVNSSLHSADHAVQPVGHGR
jgi:hypothetical protein